MFALNPAFNRMSTPPHGPHRLLLPVERVEPFQAALASGVSPERVASEPPPPPPDTRHPVRRGENLTGIARQYGVPVETLRQANNLRGSVIHPGDVLVIPGVPSARPAAGTSAMVAEARPDITAQLPERQPAPAASKSASRSYTVKSGDTLWGVARKNGVSVPALASANGLSTKSELVAGRKLQIPGGKGGAKQPAESTRMTYKVRSGDTLSEIAEKFNVSVRQLMTWNQLRQSTSLRAGQQLVVYVDPRRVNGG
jgi:membrane-bound lytic murein transglycosylase D